MDTMTTTKIIGAFCGALLIFMLGKMAAESRYSMGGGHGAGQAAAYVIEVEDGGGDAEPEAEGPSFEEMLAEADVGKGAKVFSKCKACHKAEEGVHGVGPSLYGVVGRDIGATDFGSYSGKLEQAGTVWDAETLNTFLANPKGAAPGTSMGFGGLKKVGDRADLIAYLDSLDD